MSIKHDTRKPVNGQNSEAATSEPHTPIAPQPSAASASASKRKRCPECGTDVPPKKRGIMKIFCDSKCRSQYHARSKARGQVLTPLALAWRTGRGSTDVSKKAYAAFVQALDDFAAADRKAGKPPVGEYVDRLMWMGNHRDRRRN